MILDNTFINRTRGKGSLFINSDKELRQMKCVASSLISDGKQ